MSRETTSRKLSTTTFKTSVCCVYLQTIVDDIVLNILSDSSAARGFSQRQGLGMMRRVRTRYPWMQERVKEGQISS